MLLYKIIATFFGVGYIGKGGGSVAAFLACFLIFIISKLPLNTNTTLVLLSLITLIIGVLSAAMVEKIWGKDSKFVVIDEVHGMIISLLFLPLNLLTFLLAFIIFRYFDIFKPLFIRNTEKFKGGWGVMADDLLAGVYTNIVMRIVFYLISIIYESIF